jgi:uncharacterized protein YjbI with pentapeptide repeats
VKLENLIPTLLLAAVLLMPALNASGQDLSYHDFSGSDLRGSNFAGANLSFADFTDANIEGVNFEGATVTWANFTGASGRRANFKNAFLYRSILVGGHFSDAVFFGADMKWVDARGGDFERGDLRNVNASFADFSGADLGNANISGALAPYSRFIGADATCAWFGNGNFDGADWTLATLSRAHSHPNGTQPITIAGLHNWFNFDYQTVPAIYQGFRPLHKEASGGPHGAYVWTDGADWGVDVPDDNSVLALIYSAFRAGTDLSNAAVTAKFRSNDIDMGGGALNFYVKSVAGERYHFPVATALVDGEWTPLNFTLSASQPWVNTYVRNGGTPAPIATVLTNVSEMGFSWHGFTTRPTGRLDFGAFKLDMSPAATAAYEAANPEAPVQKCLTPVRVVPWHNAI